ncbi:LysR substrate-binding domain-containing protein [Sporolactobacillus shoreae]|uniref:LysR substrate-binding domain-containing protein n=1 Tax=Sporolactobacillus shoreae TaxID=1465501 RepID=UPI00143303B0
MSDDSDVECRFESYLVGLPIHHNLVSKTRIFVSDLGNEPFVAPLREVGSFYYDSMVKVCMDAGFSPKNIQTAKDMQTVLALVSSGLGIALINESAKYIRNDIVYKPLFGTLQQAYQMSFAWKKGNNSPIVNNFLKVVKQLDPTLN